MGNNKGLWVSIWKSLQEGSFTGKALNYLKLRLPYTLFHLPELDFSGEHQFVGEIIYDDICLPPYYGHHKNNDLLPFIALIQAIDPQLVIELGTAHGNMAANVCRQTNAEVVTVNALPEQMSGDMTTFALQRDEIGRVYRKYGFDGRVTQVYENTLRLDLVNFLSPSTADLAIIDACHDFEYVVNDFLKVEPFIRPGGVVLLHDTQPLTAGHLSTSYLACMNLRRRGWNIHHIRDTWWGIWICGGIRDSTVRWLFSELPRSPLWNYLRKMY
ncbi:MAG: class I SAM-dependent methyltransferase [Anaerolineales bacterium]|nr:class I SAM-dependent methyltransferase [Chloroflexota bacterium]MBL6980710.1 class I SAM-dependent methyltransferase [Anaerolineales bacterium]